MSEGYKFVYEGGQWKAVMAGPNYRGQTIKNFWHAYAEAQLATRNKLRPTARNRRRVFASAKERESAEQLARIARKLQLEAALEEGTESYFSGIGRRRGDTASTRAGILSDLDSMRRIADELTKRKVQTPRGGSWHPQLVKRIVQRLEGEARP
jgi:hypothetical protein